MTDSTARESMHIVRTSAHPIWFLSACIFLQCFIGILSVEYILHKFLLNNKGTVLYCKGIVLYGEMKIQDRCVADHLEQMQAGGQVLTHSTIWGGAQPQRKVHKMLERVGLHHIQRCRVATRSAMHCQREHEPARNHVRQFVHTLQDHLLPEFALFYPHTFFFQRIYLTTLKPLA